MDEARRLFVAPECGSNNLIGGIKQSAWLGAQAVSRMQAGRTVGGERDGQARRHSDTRRFHLVGDDVISSLLVHPRRGVIFISDPANVTSDRGEARKRHESCTDSEVSFCGTKGKSSYKSPL